MIKREQQIKQLREHIKLGKLNKSHIKSLIVFAMANCGVSRRTAREYIEVALFMDE